MNSVTETGRTYRAYGDLSLAMLIVGSSVVAGRLALNEMPLFLALGLRFLLAACIIVPWLFRTEGGLPRLTRRELGVLAAQTFCGVFLFNVLLLYALTLTDAASAGIITSTTPACMALIAWTCLGERPDRRAGLGILLSVAGIAALHLADAQENAEEGNHQALGNMLAFGAVVGESLFLLLRKKLPAGRSALSLSTVVTLMAAAMFLVPAAYQASAFDFGTVSLQGWAVIGYYAAFITVAAYLLWFRGVVAVPAHVAGVFTGLLPVSALGFSALALGQPIGPAQAAGCALVLSGILLLAKPGRKGSGT